MQDLINELAQPNNRTPRRIELRAAKVLKELAQLQQADLAGRLRAEEKLVEAYGEIQRLRGLLNEKENNNDTTNSEPIGVSHPATKAEKQGDEVSN
jgi:sirohydrochlorin ferrochelatase